MSNFKTYDFAFIGLGAANSLLINRLHHKGLLKNKSILIFEPQEKNSNDKSFCYWADSEENKTLGIADLTKVNWDNIQVNQSLPEKLNDQKYYYVNSLDLYNQTKSILSNYSVSFIQNKVNHLEITENESIRIINKEDTYISKFIFDSRPPQWHELKSNESFIWQSFIGWRIQLDSELEDSESNTFTMMDFGVEQSNSCQFMYTLPFSKNEILVELTRFDKKILTQKIADPILLHYLQERIGIKDFKIKEIEIGKIPMSSGKIKSESINSNHILMGSAAGLVKPSTGYAFKRMAYHSLSIAQNIKENQKPNPPFEAPRRFQFYDRLLLKILENEPTTGRNIFSTLFKKVSTSLVLKFLDEKTSFIQDIKILGALPKGIFIKTAIFDIFKRIKNKLNLFIPILLSILFVFFEKLGLGILTQLGLLIGLLAVGIPHGALDHLLVTRKIQTSISPTFIFNYLFKGAGMFAIWWLSPSIGLIFFILYSAWHFGQTDSEEWNLTTNKFTQFILGIWVLVTLFSFHLNEFNLIINSIGVSAIEIPSGVLGINLILEICLFITLVFLLKLRNLYIAELFTVLAVTSRLPLLYSFGIYFIFVHSLNGWKHLKAKLNCSNWELTKKATPFSFGAVLIFIVFFSNTFGNWKSNVGPFFIFLSCISFPHVWGMTKFYFKNHSMNSSIGKECNS